ncbi:MAG: peptidoglycan-binding protein [Sterolibacteriaceae bacterium]|uniref:Peptidoglycan-binding protein n=1 Tax=Candidatus Methylophosphatis roskildensis TaxID=2899263 RepID=A0A9D7DW96_9PROT|nr:peptidoglycan-binding protein [Candidatus Methylophosphatis roskildensis]MBK7235026.1 peptidoglycan-binding protein [Sterolibacteriaceae bacterium]
MLVRANTGNACITYRFEGGQSAWTIDKSVGQGGFNHKGDVQTIQRLLNLIEVSDGGPMPPLAEDGLVGPKTIGAIRGFQQFHHTGSDGRVDPNGPTLKKMNEVPKNRLAQQNASRLARTAQAMPDLVAMARKAQRTAEAAMDFLRLGIGSSKRAHELADLHFAFGRQAQGATIAELAFIRTTFVRAAGVLVSRASPLTGGNPFGVSIYTIDPLGRDWMAYSPMQLGDDNRDIPEVHSGHVYLCNRLDAGVVPDLFTHILFHELIHFVDDESKEHRIVDHGYREKAMKLPHSLRMHNSDNYALFASHIHFGRDRLIASQPSLRPHIPANL